MAKRAARKQIKQVKRQRVYSRYARDVALLLGMQIKQARRQKGFTESALAERGGISRATLQKIESGNMGSAIGLVFEIATIVGLRLFDENRDGLLKHLQQTKHLLTLLPQRTRHKTNPIDDNF